MAIKIGKWYITKNNPRELLLQLRYKQDIIDDYKSRCEKAIEYINDKKIYDEEYGEFIYYDYLIHDRLLNILQNGSENK